MVDRKKLLVIGNKKPREDKSDIIDSFDYVIRINTMNYIKTGLIGTKTSDIFFELGNMVDSDFEINRDIFEKCKKIWLTWWTWENLYNKNLWNKYFSKEQFWNARILNKMNSYDKPSSGLIIIRYLLSNPLFYDEYDFYIHGITTHNRRLILENTKYKWHNLKKEEEELNECIKNGKLIEV